MLQWIFGSRRGAARGDDSVWMTSAARLDGIRRAVERAVAAGHSVALVAWTPAACDDLAALVEAHRPLRCRDRFERQALLRHLGRGGATAVAVAAALPSDAEATPECPVEVHVCGRSDSRSADAAVVRFADLLGSGARVSFHLAFDDPLLAGHAERVRPLLERLGAPAGEAISHPLLSRVVARAQSK
jgi:hypothetical protein